MQPLLNYRTNRDLFSNSHLVEHPFGTVVRGEADDEEYIFPDLVGNSPPRNPTRP